MKSQVYKIGITTYDADKLLYCTDIGTVDEKDRPVDLSFAAYGKSELAAKYRAASMLIILNNLDNV